MVELRRIYIDANVFITLYLKRKGHKNLEKFFKGVTDFELEFVTSDWTLTEIVKVLIKEYKINAQEVASYVEEIKREKRIEGVKFKFIEVSPKKDYDFGEFFYHLQRILLQYDKINVTDAIHNLIMEKNKINSILTADSDFKGMEGIIVINPLDCPI